MSGIEDKPSSSGKTIVFGPFRLSPARQLLLEADKPVSLGGRAFDILTALAQSAGQVVSKNELIGRVWPGAFVDEANLRVHIAAVRKALGDGQGGRRFIVTIPGRGYSFVGPVSQLAGEPSVARPEAPDAPTDNLPQQSAKVVGREGEVDALIVQLSQRRLITIVGPGGIGKTTVALAVANAVRTSYPDGAWLVDLAPIADQRLVPSVLATLLGLRVSSDDPIPYLLTILKNKRMLLLLDNCERVVDAAATLAEAVFKGAEEVQILATSREALRVEGEYVRGLPPLAAPPDTAGITALEALAFPAVQLFVERAATISGSFRLSDADAPVVAQICRRLDGIALAIELAAARVESFGAHGVASRLDDRFRFLTRGYRTALPHHQTLRATFDWSYESLGKSTRIVLRRLAVFAGDFTLDAAIEVVRAEDMREFDVADDVAKLVTASLLSTRTTGPTVSYRYLDSARAYAQEKLLQSEEFDHLSRRHCEYVRNVLVRAGADTAIWPSGKWLNVHWRQVDDVRASLDWAFSARGDPRLGVDITIAAAPLWSLMSLNEECRSRAAAALSGLDQEDACNDRLIMQLSGALASALIYTRGAGTETSALWANTLRIAEDAQDVDYQLRALKGLWTDAYNTGRLVVAEAFGERFSRIAATSSDPADGLLRDRMMAMERFYVGDLGSARSHIERALRGHIRSPSASDVLRFQFDQRMIAASILYHILWLQGFPDQARRMAEESVGYARAADHAQSVTYALAYASCRLELYIGDLNQTERYLVELSQRARLDPASQWDIFGRCWTGILLNKQGNATAAMNVLASALDGVPEHSFSLQYSSFLGELALAMGRAGEIVKAVQAIARAVEICDRLGERWGFAELLRIKGEITLIEGGLSVGVAAEEHFQHSLDWARRQGALSWELRTATSFARLRLAQGRSRDASELLAPVYRRFTEGFATSDLRAAKDLLGQVE